MKTKYFLMFLTFLLAAAPVALAQVTPNTQVIQGTLRFNNTNPNVLSRLAAGRGMENAYLFANAQAPAPAISASASDQLSTDHVTTPYEIIVQSNPSGYVYEVNPRATLGGRQTYWFTPQLAPAVTPTGGPVTLDFTECVSIIEVEFVDDAGRPVAVNGGKMSAYNPPHSTITSPDMHRVEIPDGATSEILVVRGDSAFTIDVTVEVGSSTYTDELLFLHHQEVETDCDEVMTITCVVPNSDDLGTIEGRVDLLDEFEITLDARDALNYPDYTAIVADNGPFDNQRYAHVSGVNFTTPASGPYDLINLLPSSADPVRGDYRVHAKIMFRTNNQFSIFRSPALGSGMNPGVIVPDGGTVNLGDTFVIDPGYISGDILLQGPPELPGQPSMLRGLTQTSADDLDGDGIPDTAGTYGVNRSSIAAEGVDRLASGATHSASYGFSRSAFEGAFQPAAHAFEGDYELVVGGINSEPSIWDPKHMRLVFAGGDTTNGTYYYNSFSIRDKSTNEFEVFPGTMNNNDVAYCLSEVLVRFRSSTENFYNPEIRFSHGSFNGTDFQGDPANYDVSLNIMRGAPTTIATATNVGYVRMLLPEGTYDLRPFIRPAASPESYTELEPINVTVGGCDRIVLEDCLQLTLNAPSCVNTQLVEITGSVRTEERCGNNVTQITYRLNDGPEHVICTGCGMDPSFIFNLNLPPSSECEENVLTVTAIDNDGRVSSVTRTIRLDSTPPEIECPKALEFNCIDQDELTVTYTPTATDNCGDVEVVCNPPSGSTFPVGTTEVNCVAVDDCGNVSECSFPVIVRPPTLNIRRAICVEWDCQGILQGANTVNGPWIDIPTATSPYCVPASAAQRYYRVRR